MSEENKIKLGYAVARPSLAACLPVHHISQAPSDFSGRMTNDWSKVTCGTCRLKQPVSAEATPGVVEYQIPENVRQRDAQLAREDAERQWQRERAFVSYVYGQQRAGESFMLARQHVLNQAHRAALLENADREARRPAAFLEQLRVRAEKMDLLAAEKRMQEKLSRMTRELYALYAESSDRAQKLEEEIKRLS